MGPTDSPSAGRTTSEVDLDLAPAERALDDGEIYVAVGDVVAGKYRVERMLGTGGMAFVLSAKHVELEEHFALKFLNKEFVRQTAVIERFSREAKAACKIRSEHVARVYDVGTHHGAPFLVMEQLEGRDLATVVAQGGALRVGDAVEYAVQACQALAAAHAHGIVHRDIKPENLFLIEHDGLPILKLLDFGISKSALTGDGSSSRLTGHMTLGTPQYMSPEQIRSSASADARSDLWSLGVVLYELLTGTEAFKADTATGLCAVVLEQEPRPLRELRPDIPQALADVVARCMKKDAASRFASVAELAVALLPFAPLRAVVSAQRSSSIMSAARRAEGGDPVSSGLPSTESPTWRAFSRDASGSGSPASQGPLLQEPAHAGAGRRSERSGGSLRLAAAALAIVAALGAQAYRALGPHAAGRATVAASPLPPTSAEATPPAASPDGPRAIDAAGARVDSLVARSVLPKRAALPHPSAPLRLGVPRAPLLARTVGGADAAAPGASAAPASPGAVELGY